MAATRIKKWSHTPNTCPFCKEKLRDEHEGVEDLEMVEVDGKRAIEIERCCPECWETFYELFEMSYKGTFFRATILH